MSTTTIASPAAVRPTGAAGVLHALIATPSDPAATVARLALGAMILPHGLQKTFGLFGGYGWEGTMGFLTGAAGLPWLVAALVILAELLGGIGLLFGALGRVAAAGVAAVMLGAVATVHFSQGFFMNWNGTMPAGAEGWEFHLLAVALAAVVAIRGSGALSLDRAWTTGR